MKCYKHSIPPQYSVKNTEVRTAVESGLNDNMADPKDVKIPLY